MAMTFLTPDASGTQVIKEKTVLEIWNDEPYRAMRRKHLAGTLNQLCESQCGLP